MKKGIWNAWVLLAVIGVLLVGVVWFAGPTEVLKRVVIALTEDTEYAAGYSESAFEGVAVGDTEASVRAALGAPLRESAAEPYTCWLYAPDPHPEFAASGAFPDMRYSFTSIRFGEDGRFDSAFGQLTHGSETGFGGVQVSASIGDGANTLALTNAEAEALEAEGATADRIEARFGKPRAVFESRVVEWLQYSRSPGSTHYRQRVIGIDRDGRVCRKVSEVYWD